MRIHPLTKLAELAELRVEHLYKSFDHNLSHFELEAHFSVGVGERVALLGKSGIGKTMLLRMIAGLEAMDTPMDQSHVCANSRSGGKIFLGNVDITRLSPQKREIGYVFQDFALFTHLNVMDNVTFGLRMRGMGSQDGQKTGLHWLEKVGLDSRAFSAVTKLSGGERQRVALIRALIWNPRVILLDEPFSALDPELRVVLRKELVKLHQIWPAPMVIVTHDAMDIESVATSSLKLDWDPVSRVRKVRESLSIEF